MNIMRLVSTLSAFVLVASFGHQAAVATPLEPVAATTIEPVEATTIAPAKAMCLLIFEREDHPITRRVVAEFSARPDIDLVVEATPLDFYRCLKGNYRQVTFIAHSVEMDDQGTGINLGFFKRLSGAENESQRQRYVEYLERSRAEFARRVLNVAGGEHNTEQLRLEEEIRNVDQEITRMQSGAPLYSKIYTFHGKTFSRAIEEYQSGLRTVQKIRFLNCDSEKIRERYNAEFEQLSQAGLSIEFAPKNRFWSWIFGKETTTLDFDWIRQGLNSP